MVVKLKANVEKDKLFFVNKALVIVTSKQHFYLPFRVPSLLFQVSAFKSISQYAYIDVSARVVALVY